MSAFDAEPDPGAPGSIRRRGARDVDACARLLARVHDEDGYPYRWPADAARWLEPRGSICAWVAELADAITGHVVLRDGAAEPGAAVWSRAVGAPPERLAAVTRLFVDPQSRGIGLGRRLLETACQEAAVRGLHPALDVVETNRAAIALYERGGWTRVASEPWDVAPHLTLHYYVAPAGNPGLKPPPPAPQSG